jgi:hypothetical protein
MQLAREGSPLSWIALTQTELSRKSNQVARARIRRFESDMPSQAVQSLRAMCVPQGMNGGHVIKLAFITGECISCPAAFLVEGEAAISVALTLRSCFSRRTHFTGLRNPCRWCYVATECEYQIRFERNADA